MFIYILIIFSLLKDIAWLTVEYDDIMLPWRYQSTIVKSTEISHCQGLLYWRQRWCLRHPMKSVPSSFCIMQYYIQMYIHCIERERSVWTLEGQHYARVFRAEVIGYLWKLTMMSYKLHIIQSVRTVIWTIYGHFFSSDWTESKKIYK